jgi:hypothetical protein
MKSRFDLVMIASAICVAGYAVIALGYLALHNFGLSRDLASCVAMLAAILIAATLAMNHFGKRLRNTKY